MSEEFTTTVAEKPDTSARPMDRPVIHQTIEEGESTSTRSGTTGSYSDTFDREIPEAILAKIDAFKKAVDEEPVEEVAVVEDVEGAAKEAAEKPADPAVEAKPADSAKPVTKVEPPAEAPELVEFRTKAERFEEANKRLVADLEAERKKPAAIPERLQKLDAAAAKYLDDDTSALREFIAHSIGSDDPNSKEVDAELEFQYAALTSKSLGVTPDANHLALRENARTRQLLARQKRERQAEGETSTERAKAEAEAKAAATVHEVIGNRLQSKRDDGRQVGDDYPLLMSLAETFDGAKPSEVLWKVIQNGFHTGRFDPKQTDDQLIAQAAPLVEKHYQALVDKVTKAHQPKPTTSTDTPSEKSPAAPSSTSKDRAPVPARTLTNADASVAPAAPPAKKPAAATTTKPMTKEQRKEYALRHLSK